MAAMKKNGKLAAYRAKRDFKKTAEPSGKEKSAPKGFSYLIQKHAARRLHYDFRLELEGTLKSWAVTRGPSLDPADKRLAVHVEDHPLSYGTFEGTIPQGQYGGGTVMLWDRGSWEPIGDLKKDYAKGRLTFILHGERLTGEWHLVRMGGKAGRQGKHENWLLIKSHDDSAHEGDGDYALDKFQTSVVTGRTMRQIAEGKKTKKLAAKKPETAKKILESAAPRGAKGKLPAFVPPQLATLVKSPPRGAQWVHEIKFDGYRALCHVEKGKIKLLTRANNDWTAKFRGLPERLKKLPLESALIDGEVVVLKQDGTMSFAALQHALGKSGQGELHYYAFDLLYLNGQDLTALPLLERKQALRDIIPQGDSHLHYSDHFTEPGDKVLDHACHIALEGIVSKRADARYSKGRSKTWLKTKCANAQEMVAGKAGTGFSREVAAGLIKKFVPLRQKQSAFKTIPNAEKADVQWLKPTLVAEVGFSEWTESGALRHPSFHALREDKPAEQIVREKPIATPVAKPEKRAKSPLLPKGKNVSTEVAGVTLSHPDKLVFPDEKITKLDVAHYYETVAPYLLEYAASRPISLMRCPDGTGKACFFQRHIDEGLPKYIKTKSIAITETRDYLYIENVQGLIALVQMGVIEIHCWGAQAKTADRPNRMIFDLDPGEDVSWVRVKEAALQVRDGLRQTGLKSFLEVTGGKGLHIVAPLRPGPNWDKVKAFTHEFARIMEREEPKLYTTSSRKNERAGRIYIDYLRNGKGASAITPYSLRARKNAPVAVPIDWSELNHLANAHTFTMDSVLVRLEKSKRNPWTEMNELQQKLPNLGKM
jgi:bifunctional non-homologous end joining protein LigD